MNSKSCSEWAWARVACTTVVMATIACNDWTPPPGGAGGPALAVPNSVEAVTSIELQFDSLRSRNVELLMERYWKFSPNKERLSKTFVLDSSLRPLRIQYPRFDIKYFSDPGLNLLDASTTNSVKDGYIIIPKRTL